MDVAFIVDSSTSINFWDTTTWTTICEFFANLTDRFDIGPNTTQLAVMHFSNRSSVMIPFSQYHQKPFLVHAIRHMPYSGGRTNLNDALYNTWSNVYAVGGGCRLDAAKIAIILTDGVDNVPDLNSTLTIQNALRCKQIGVRLIVIGVRTNSALTVNNHRLLQIVSSPDDYFYASNANVLKELIPVLLRRLFTASTISPVTG